MHDKNILENVENILKKTIEDLSLLQKNSKDIETKNIIRKIQDNIWGDFLMVTDKQISNEEKINNKS